MRNEWNGAPSMQDRDFTILQSFQVYAMLFFSTKWCSLVAWTPIGSGVSSSYHSATKGPFLKQVRKGHAVSWISLCIFNRWVWSNLFMYFLLWMTFRQLLTTSLVYVTHKTRTVNKDPKDVVKPLPSIATRKNKVKHNMPLSFPASSLTNGYFCM